ncbi:MAG: T9SS type A sorting domain-containing protein [Flavobacteriales bacterium]|nr:T9SS type A sorting domain-containing protein [Flavobacteriales bacterium]
MRSNSLFITLLLLANAAQAQVLGPEELGPLHARPMGEAPGELRSTLNELFIYQYLPQEVPVEDDFSTDRTRHLTAQAGDADVSLTNTYYHLEVGGVSTADMAYSTDTTYRYTFDVSDPDTVIKDTIPNPVVVLTVYDLGVNPPTSTVVDAWLPFNIIDTLGVSITNEQLTPDLVQDSLFVYAVAADARTYQQGLTQVPLVLWESDHAYVNRTYAVDPPTIGIATFDGLDRTGFPYDVSTALPYGECDRLTSVPIDLQYPAGDSVYLSFMVQPQGLSGDDQIQVQDSLVLDLYAPNDDEWVQVWSSEYTSVQPFRQVMLPITETRFLQQGFRMRWRNYGTRSGALDQWHLDYVRLGRNRSFDDTVLVDVAFVMPEASLLETYTSVPFAKFSASPSSYMAQDVELTMKNLDVNDKFITWGYFADIDGDPAPPFEECENYGNNISNNAETTFTTTHPIAAGACGFTYDPALSTDAAFWRNTFWLDATPNVIPYNDTMSFVQELSNYYSYDDGSAEAGYSLNQQGAKVAVRFDTQGSDSLRAVRMYFDPIFSENDPTDGNFLITVWTSLSPEVIQFQNVSFTSPTYRYDGPNKFVEFALDSTIAVQGTFYVGWTQTNAIKMNVGFDKNRNNQDKIYYKVSGPFANTGFEGSLMLRPVMVSAVDPWASVPEPEEERTLEVFPNPVGDLLNVRLQDDGAATGVELLDAMGRVVRREGYRSGLAVGVSDLAPGLYVVRVVDAQGMALGQQRILVQR